MPKKYSIYLKEAKVTLVVGSPEMSLTPAECYDLRLALSRWARAANKVRAVQARPRPPKFYRPKRTWDEKQQEMEAIRKGIEKMEHCSQCGELFMESMSCGISHGIIKQQKKLVKKWDMELDMATKKNEAVSIDIETNSDFDPWGDSFRGYNDPMEGL